MATTTPRALALDCLPDERNPSSMYGFASRERPSDPRATHAFTRRRPCGSPPLRLRCLRGRAKALCCDVTLVSPLTREGRPQPSAASHDGAAIAVADRRKRAACPELLRPEAGGRWSAESLRLLSVALKNSARAKNEVRGAGMTRPTPSCRPQCDCGAAALQLRCAAPWRAVGRTVGAGYRPSRCTWPLPRSPWARLQQDCCFPASPRCIRCRLWRTCCCW